MPENQYSHRVPYITIEADVWNATWINGKALQLVEKRGFPIETEVRSGESLDITFILIGAVVTIGTATASGFGWRLGQDFAKDLYRYVRRRMKAVEKQRRRTPKTRQKVRLVRHSVELNEVLEEVEKEDL